MPESSTPRITDLRVVPVAGRDSMLLNLSGAHGPFFTRKSVMRGVEDSGIACLPFYGLVHHAKVYAVFTVVKNSCAYLPCSRGP